MPAGGCAHEMSAALGKGPTRKVVGGGLPHTAGMRVKGAGWGPPVGAGGVSVLGSRSVVMDLLCGRIGSL